MVREAFLRGSGTNLSRGERQSVRGKTSRSSCPSRIRQQGNPKLSCKRCVCPRPQAPFHQQLKPIKSKECTAVLNRRSRQNEGGCEERKRDVCQRFLRVPTFVFSKLSFFFSFFLGLLQIDQCADHKRYEFKIQGQNSPIPTSWRV